MLSESWTPVMPDRHVANYWFVPALIVLLFPAARSLTLALSEIARFSWEFRSHSVS